MDLDLDWAAITQCQWNRPVACVRVCVFDMQISTVPALSSRTKNNSQSTVAAAHTHTHITRGNPFNMLALANEAIKRQRSRAEAAAGRGAGQELQQAEEQDSSRHRSWKGRRVGCSSRSGSRKQPQSQVLRG